MAEKLKADHAAVEGKLKEDHAAELAKLKEEMRASERRRLE